MSSPQLRQLIQNSLASNLKFTLLGSRKNMCCSCVSKGASVAGACLGLDDQRTALVKEVFAIIDKCPNMKLAKKFVLFSCVCVAGSGPVSSALVWFPHPQETGSS